VKAWFKSIENLPEGSVLPVDEVVNQLSFDRDALLPVIVQEHSSRQVLMFAWMNRAALEETLQTGQMCYFSRSRQSLWRKGESSGHRQLLRSLRTDCDGDVLLAEVEQIGAACHTFRNSCFYLKFDQGRVILDPADR
jgi:phosphoribosyl-AMP cyclohydrolase